MLKKKLLTIAGALGILACGACFLPPIHNSPPPPQPPPLIRIPADVQTVRVVVIDKSLPANIDAGSIAASVADYINRTHGGQGITAYAGEEHADADLEVSIAGEDAAFIKALPNDGTESWSFSFKLSVALLRNGNILSQRPDVPIRVELALPGHHPNEVWLTPEVQRACASLIELGSTRGVIF